jgi:hypothetical protein
MIDANGVDTSDAQINVTTPISNLPCPKIIIVRHFRLALRKYPHKRLS